uniref:RING-type domain-containing protein n=1 Tax=Anopheles dirus TaxID=7168 RepID=A0A182N7L0_9DIPT
MPPARWIHCNMCFYLMAKQDRKFYHLSCRHVLCRQCMSKTNRGTMCAICSKPLERFTELSNQMDRREKMYYDPGVLQVLSATHQTIMFQHKQRENLVKRILRCRYANAQMKDMENQMRQKIVEAQRRYEKFRNYRRNLQEVLRQSSPRQSAGALVPLAQITSQQRPPQLPPTPALSNRDGDSTSRRHDQRSVTPVASDKFNPLSTGNWAPVATVEPGLNRQHVLMLNHSQRSNITESVLGERSRVVANFADDSGVSSLHTPTSSFGSRRTSPKMHQYQIRRHLHSGADKLIADGGVVGTLSPFTRSGKSSVLPDDGTTWLLLLCSSVVSVPCDGMMLRAAAVATEGVETAEDVSISEQKAASSSVDMEEVGCSIASSPHSSSSSSASCRSFLSASANSSFATTSTPRSPPDS